MSASRRALPAASLALVVTVSLALACLIAGGCAMDSGQARVTPEYTLTVKKVGVMSLVDPLPNLSYLRSSALESNFAQLAVPGWNADALVDEVLQGRLKRKGFDVINVAPDERVRAAYGSDWGFPASEPLHAAVYDLGAALGLDMIVVVCRQVESDLVTGTNQNIRGYGLQKAFDTGPYAYAVVFVEALDIRRRFTIGAAQGEQHGPLAPEIWQPEFETAKGELAVPPVHQATVRDTLQRLLVSAVGVAIQEAGL